MTAVETQSVRMVGSVNGCMSVDFMSSDYHRELNGHAYVTGQYGDMNISLAGWALASETFDAAAGTATLVTAPCMFVDLNTRQETIAIATVVVHADKTFSLRVVARDGGAVLADSKGPVALTSGSVRF